MVRKRTAFLFFLVLWLVSVSSAFAGQAAEKIIYEKDSLYQHIFVMDSSAARERYVFSNKREVTQGAMSLDAPDKLVFEYTQMAFVSLAFLNREPKDVLFIGLGAGSMPKYLSKYYPQVNIDVVEIDSDMVDVARRFFQFKETSAMKAHVIDGRVFVKRTPKKYDMIFLDAYQGGDIPFHLTTVEFFREIKGKLKDGGVVVSNIMSPFGNKFFNSMVVTHEKEFPNLYIFKGRRSGNYIFIGTKGGALKGKNEIYRNAQRVQAAKKLDIDLGAVGMTCEYCADYRTDAKILTDDFAPVNLYRHMRTKK